VPGFPAATAIGHQHATGRLQVFWLAARIEGTAVENPRQVSAYRYPRVHGPVSPSFARATLAGDGALLISGTASIVGHSSVHDNDIVAQLDETVRNLSALQSLALPQAPTMRTLLKAYVRHAADAETVARRLRTILPPELVAQEVIYLAADICRRELLLEIEGIQIPV
jgi:chorismate lyase/3-hydroxybenzoate synthase